MADFFDLYIVPASRTYYFYAGVIVMYLCGSGLLLMQYAEARSLRNSRLYEFLIFFTTPLTFIMLMTLIIIAFAAIYKLSGLVSGAGLDVADWDDALYFSIVTWTTLGYGDYSPRESLRLVAAIQGLIGYLFSGVVVALTLDLLGRTYAAINQRSDVITKERNVHG
ncbi:MAG: potassium channel family protein [Geminicoccaceae bacterium]|nr:potassium channel family protein [Geminicoccaceae bacterium]